MSLTKENVGSFTFCFILQRMIFVYMFLSEKISVKLVSVCPYSDMKKERKKDKECYRKNLKSGTSFPAKISFSRELNMVAR